jgi:hypothetical protein
MNRRGAVMLFAALLALAFASAAAAHSLTLRQSYYTGYTKVIAKYHIGNPGGCVDEYGFPLEEPGCQDWYYQNGSIRLDVYQTYPRWRRVKHEREELYGSPWTESLYSFDIGFPYFCPYSGYYRNYKTVVTLEGNAYFSSISRARLWYSRC